MFEYFFQKVAKAVVFKKVMFCQIAQKRKQMLIEFVRNIIRPKPLSYWSKIAQSSQNRLRS